MLPNVNCSSTSDAPKEMLDVRGLERRISSLESIAQRIEMAGSQRDDADYQKLKESVQGLLSVREKLREMEDLDLITKLETIQTQDEIVEMQDDVSKLRKKVDLISDAVKIINAKIDGKMKNARDDGHAVASHANVSLELENSIEMIRKDIDVLRQKVELPREDVHVASTGSLDVKALEDKYDTLEVKMNAFMDNTKALIEINEMKRSKEAEKAKAIPAPDAGHGQRLESLESEYDSVKSLVDGINKSILDSRADISRLKLQIDAVNARQSHEQEQCSHGSVLEDPELRDELQDFSIRISSVEDRIQSLIVEWGLIDKKSADASKIEGISKDVAEFGQQVEGIRKSLGDVQKMLDSRISGVDGSIATLKSDIAKRLDSEIGAVKSGLEKSDAHISEMMKSSDARLSEQDKMFKEMDKLFKSEIAKVKASIEAGKARDDPKIRDMAGRVKALELEQKILKDAYDGMMKTISAGKKGIPDAKELDAFRIQFREMVMRVRDYDVQLKEHRRKFSGDIYQLKNDFAVIDSKIALIEERLGSGMSELEAGIEGVQNTSDMLNNSVKKITDDLKAENELLARQLNDLKATVAARASAEAHNNHNAHAAKSLPVPVVAVSHLPVAAAQAVPAVAVPSGNVQPPVAEPPAMQAEVAAETPTTVGVAAKAVDSADINSRIADLESKVNDFDVLRGKLLDYLKNQASVDAEGKIKYVPVIKENVAKLYHTYKDTEKRMSFIEGRLAGLEADIDGRVESKLKPSVDTLSKSLGDRVNTVEAAGLKMRRLHESELLMLKSEIARILEVQKRVEDMDLDEFAEFRNRVLGNIDEIRLDVSAINAWKDANPVSGLKESIENDIKGYSQKLDGFAASAKMLDSRLKVLDESGKAVQKRHDSDIASIKADISKVLASMSSKKSESVMDIEEMAQFREKVLGHIDELRLNINSLATKTDGAELVDSKVKAAVERELADVVGNIDVLAKDIKSRADLEKAAHESLADKVRKDYQRELIMLKSDIANLMSEKRKSNDMSYEEFAEFRAKVLDDIDSLKSDVKGMSKVVTSSEVENMIDGRLVKHAEHIDNIAKLVKLLDRKIEQRHLEVAQNSHKKIADSYKSVDERLSALEGDIMMLKDMRGDLVDDVNEVIDHMKNANDPDPQMQIVKRMSDFEGKIQSLEAGLSSKNVLEQRLVAMQRESDILRNELENMKALYFQLLKKEEEYTPLVIE